MIGLVIFLGITFCVVTYVLLCHHCIDILDCAGCRGTFVEWFSCLCPFVHIIIYVKYKEIAGYKPWKKKRVQLKNEYRNMVDKLNEKSKQC